MIEICLCESRRAYRSFHTFSDKLLRYTGLKRGPEKPGAIRVGDIDVQVYTSDEFFAIKCEVNIDRVIVSQTKDFLSSQ